MVSIKRLTRGLKLLRDHIYTPLSDVASKLANPVTGGLTPEELETGYSTFRLNFYIPYTNLKAKTDDRARQTSVTIPFVLPPPQESFALNNALIDDYQLTSVSVGTDTRCEPGRLLGVRDAAPSDAEGLVVENEGVAFTVHLMEKTMDRGAALGVDKPFKNEIFQMTIPEVALLDSYKRANPHVQDGMSVSIRHDRSYLLEFVPEKTDQPTFSLFVSLKLKRKLMSRDLATTQNIPAHNGAMNRPTVTINTPAADSVITAGGVGGVNTNFSTIDSLVSSGLAGGYFRNGQRQEAETILSNAGYDVIAVPMFSGWSVHGAGSVGSPEIRQPAASLPYAAAGAGNFKTMDRAVIPLHYPITIHHVLIANSHASDALNYSSTRPVSPNFRNEVGVGLMTGIRSDNFEIQQVATADWVPATRTNFLVDTSANKITAGAANGYFWDILACPLIGNAGVGFTAQGAPIFAGQGETPTQTRSNMQLSAAPAITLGAEQALDIRWKITDTIDPDAGGASWPATSSVVGWPGQWVYIICKKHLI